MTKKQQQKSPSAFVASLGLAIGHFREELGISQADLARRIDYNKGGLSRIENGKQGFSTETLEKVIDVLHMPLSVLANYAEGKTQENQEIAIKRLTWMYRQSDERSQGMLIAAAKHSAEANRPVKAARLKRAPGRAKH
jgi:transcriptional regulator with XRE-family HTH domain